jgi:hypothetical protein
MGALSPGGGEGDRGRARGGFMGSRRVRGRWKLLSNSHACCQIRASCRNRTFAPRGPGNQSKVTVLTHGPQAPDRALHEPAIGERKSNGERGSIQGTPLGTLTPHPALSPLRGEGAPAAPGPAFEAAAGYAGFCPGTPTAPSGSRGPPSALSGLPLPSTGRGPG